MTTLLIDTSDTKHIQVAIVHDGKRYERVLPSKIARAQTVLPLTEELLREASIHLVDLTEIQIVDDGASYTGLRVGFAIANMLGKLLGIPVNGKKGLAYPKEHQLHYKEIA